MAEYIISVDIGTQGCKAALFRSDLHLVDTAFEESRLVSPQVGAIWQEPDDIYGACVRVIKELVEKNQDAAVAIQSIAVDAQMAGIMGVGVDGEAVTVYDSWLDTRCAAQVSQMKKLAGKEITRITGGPVSFTQGPRILRLKQQEPSTYRSVHKFVLPNAYVVGKMAGLTGDEMYFDYTGLQYSGFGDNLNKTWSADLLDCFGINPSCMARIVSPFDVVGHTTEGFARDTGTVAGIPVVAGCGDTAASAFGSGMLQKELLLDCAGTASVLCSTVDTYSPDVENETLTLMRSPIDGLWMPMAYINGGGLCVRWLRDQFAGETPVGYDQLEEEASGIAPGSEGLMFVPHFSGRVLPYNPHMKGTMAGINWNHTRGHMYRSVMESIGYEYACYLKILKSLYPHCSFNTMYALGGGSRSALFNQIKADILGVRVVPFEMAETALMGSAVIAAVGTGMMSDYSGVITKAMTPQEGFVPCAGAHRQYQQMAEEYLLLLETMTGFYQETSHA